MSIVLLLLFDSHAFINLKNRIYWIRVSRYVDFAIFDSRAFVNLKIESTALCTASVKVRVSRHVDNAIFDSRVFVNFKNRIDSRHCKGMSYIERS